MQRVALIGKIAVGLAHDKNGPAGVIIGFADLARGAIKTATRDGFDKNSTDRLT